MKRSGMHDLDFIPCTKAAWGRFAWQTTELALFY